MNSKFKKREQMKIATKKKKNKQKQHKKIY